MDSIGNHLRCCVGLSEGQTVGMQPQPEQQIKTQAAVVLAAGGGTRYLGDTHKLLAEVDGLPIVVRAVNAARGAGLDEVIVVQGSLDLTKILPDDVTIIQNERWNDGQSTSLRAAVGYADSRRHGAIIVGLGDQPGVPVEAWKAVAESEHDIAIAEFGGDKRPPVRLSAAMWASLPVGGDEGARSLMRAHPELVYSVPCHGNPADIDTLEDLRRWS